MSSQLTIQSAFGPYTTSFPSDITRELNRIVQTNQVHILVDQSIWKRYKDLHAPVARALSRRIFLAKEKYKTFESVAGYISFLLKHHVQKHHTIVVIGGGLVQDIGSFTAHVLKRGIPWIFIPTTLLSMADSCIGSKSGINVGIYKNQIGSFEPPKEIYLYPKFLQTLPTSDIQNGNGEIIKHAILKGGKIFSLLTEGIRSIPKDLVKTQEIIYQSILVKKEIIEEDEFDKGKRRLLNYGHTFGHAIEGYTKNKIPHGIAVTTGMDLANFISMRRGILDKREFQNMSRLLHANIPYKTFLIKNVDAYMDFLSQDKKVIGKDVNALLCRGVGKVEITKIKLDTQLKNEIIQYLSRRL